MRPARLLGLGLAAFLLALLVVFPASWMGGLLPPAVQCENWAGSVWRGQCRGLALQDGEKVVMRLDALQWKLRPAALLRLKLAAQFESRWPQGDAAGDVAVSPGGAIEVRGMSGRSVLDKRFFGAMPAGWQGNIDIGDFDLDWHQGVIGRLSGQLMVTNLADARGTALGSYRLEFPDGPAPYNGQLTDAGGPLEVNAQLQLTQEQSWSLEGRMRTRDAGDARLNRALDMLSSPDATGWRRLSAAGQFR